MEIHTWGHTDPTGTIPALCRAMPDAGAWGNPLSSPQKGVQGQELLCLTQMETEPHLLLPHCLGWDGHSVGLWVRNLLG